METRSQAACPECGTEVEFATAACPNCGQELSWPGQEREQKSFARPDQEALGCFLVPATSAGFAFLMAVLLAGAFALIQGRYGSLIVGLAAIVLIASWIKRTSQEEEEPDRIEPKVSKGISRKGAKTQR